MKKLKHFLLLILVVSSFPAVCAQSFSVQQIQLAEQLHSLAKNSPPEIPYIQTSKDIYETGEDLWFKIYILDSQYFIPSRLSRTLYMQLKKESSEKVIWEEKYEILNGFTSGHIYIESTLTDGDYLLYAFTPNSFFNDASEFKTLKRIIIRNEISTKPILKENSARSIIEKPLEVKAGKIQFNTFPEGGYLIYGIQNKLAFKAVNTKGEPVDIKGTLYEDSNPLISLKSIYAGMGTLEFKPGIGKKYTIRLSEPVIDSIFLLPEIKTAGMTLQLVGSDSESVSFKVSQMPEVNQEDIYIRIQCRGVVYGMTKARLNKELRIKIPLAGLPQGIAEVTLFNSSMEPVAERLVYINFNRKLNITASLSKEIYSTRGKATLKITVKDEYGKPVMANVGVTVFDKSYQNPLDSNNILSYYYLSAQLKGRIYNPSFYFNIDSKSRDEALDLLMLTQGWRKYVWNELTLKESDHSLQQVVSDGILGELVDLKSGKRNTGKPVFVTVFSPNKDKRRLLIQSDSLRKFVIPPEYLKAWEGEYIYLKPVGSTGTKPDIRLTDSFKTINLLMKTKQICYPIPDILNETAASENMTVIGSNVTRIKDVTIKGTRSGIIRGKYLGNLDSLAKLRLFNDPDDYVCSYGYLNCPSCGRGSESVKPENGKLYKFFMNGATVIVRYGSPPLTEEELLEMNNLTRVKAYYENRVFYKPNYDIAAGDSLLPDFRNTLLWEPLVETDENGEAVLDFFTSDINTDFVGRIEGVSNEGLLGAGYFRLTTRKMKMNP